MKFQEKLQNIMRDKTVVLAANSPSIGYWVDRNYLFKNKNFCFGANNLWMPIERDLLEPVEQQLQLVLVSAGRSAYFEQNIPFSENKNSLLFVTKPSYKTCKRKNKFVAIANELKDYYKNTDSFFIETIEDMEKFEKYDMKEPLVFPRLDTIHIITILSLFGHCKDIFIIGADGGYNEDFAYYFNNHHCHYKCECGKKRKYKKSITKKDKIAKEIINNMNMNIPIYICSTGSKYNFGDKIDKDLAQDILFNKY